MQASVLGERSARIGPNSILQMAEALRASGGEALEQRIFECAQLTRYISAPPHEMVAEAEAAALFKALYANVDAREAGRIAQIAGEHTGAYILAHRIPAPAQKFLRKLPPLLAARVLMLAISKHAWTFAGSGAVTCHYGRQLALEIEANPLAQPGCIWHKAVFEALLHSLVKATSSVRHTRCCLSGEPACRFEIDL